MSVVLTSNFFLNARGLTFQDASGVTWSLNPNTNVITANASGGGAVSANPTAKVGLAAVNGSAATWMRSDAAPPIDQAITPTWTALHTFTGGVTITNGGILTVDGHTLSLTGNATLSGTNTGDQVVPTSASPTATVGLAAANGSATTFMRSDAAPALSVSISPTWSGSHTFTNAITVNAGGSSIKGGLTVTAPGSGVPLTVNGVAGGGGLYNAAVTTNGTSTADLQNASTGTSADVYLRILNSADAAVFGITSTGWNTHFFTGDPGAEMVIFGTSASIPITIGTGGVERIRVSNSGVTCSGEFAINAGTPTAPLAGFGSPVGTPTSGLTNASTLPQTAGTLAALLAYLKTIGFVGT